MLVDKAKRLLLNQSPEEREESEKRYACLRKNTKTWLLGAQRREQATECIRENQVVIKDDMVTWHAINITGWDTVAQCREVVMVVVESTL